MFNSLIIIFFPLLFPLFLQFCNLTPYMFFPNHLCWHFHLYSIVLWLIDLLPLRSVNQFFNSYQSKTSKIIIWPCHKKLRYCRYIILYHTSTKKSRQSRVYHQFRRNCISSSRRGKHADAWWDTAPSGLMICQARGLDKKSRIRMIRLFWSEQRESNPQHQLGKLRFYH